VWQESGDARTSSAPWCKSRVFCWRAELVRSGSFPPWFFSWGSHGGEARRRTGPAFGVDLELVLEVPLERVVSGGEESLRFTCPGMCQNCQGPSAKAGPAPRRCEACSGTGQHATSAHRAGISVQPTRPAF